MCWRLFLKAWRSETLLKKDSNTGAFLWNLEIFKSNFFYRTPLVAASAKKQEQTQKRT